MNSSSRDHAPSISGGQGNPTLAIGWEDAAEALCDRVLQRAPDLMRRISDDLYAELLMAAQDYLRDNMLANLGGELWRAQTDERECREGLNRIADALGIRRAHPTSISWPTHTALADEIIQRIAALMGSDGVGRDPRPTVADGDDALSRPNERGDG